MPACSETDAQKVKTRRSGVGMLNFHTEGETSINTKRPTNGANVHSTNTTFGNVQRKIGIENIDAMSKTFD